MIRAEVISVIIPTLNEEQVIGDALAALQAERTPAEILVIDGGSRDRTAEIVRGSGGAVRYLGQDPAGPRGRGAACNQAARHAEGDVLLFLHVDSRLPEGGLALVDRAMRDPAVAGGGFLPTFGEAGRGLVRALLVANERVWRWRTRAFRWFAGDQAPFIRRDLLAASGGYPTIRLAEDWAFASRLRSFRRLAIIERPVTVNPRRYLANGVVKTLLVTGSVEAMYRLGLSPALLAWWYRRWLPRERG